MFVRERQSKSVCVRKRWGERGRKGEIVQDRNSVCTRERGRESVCVRESVCINIMSWARKYLDLLSVRKCAQETKAEESEKNNNNE